ncbi:RagB/SusD family nutrient uptake outer membrane protein [Marinoscillum sp.]|uniref:RagB/SusD family nutrient uptake outer membrane protein n=1 Tax=Marinoscillum sp. TaxID=2024838 RepID=UPI003BAC6FAE
MNKLIRASIILMALVAISCEDYLETEQITTITSGNYYSTLEQAETALVGCYDGLQRVWESGISFPVASTVMADMAFGGTGAADGDNYPMMDEFDKTRSPGDLNMFEPNWSAYYRTIFRVNTLLLSMEEYDWVTEHPERAAIIESEARFIRAYCYFDMVRMFERVPLLTEPSRENLPQADPDDTYAQIAEDLLFAIENGDSRPYASIPAAEYGHANKWAAQALLARVYLYYTGYYGASDLVGEVSGADALGHLEDLIANGGFDLLPTYSDLWPAAATYMAAQRGDSISNSTYAGENHQEIVFGIKYTYTSDWNGNADGNHWMVMNGLRSQAWGPLGYGNGWGACTVPPSVYANWDSNDERKEASIMAIDEENIDFGQVNDAKEYTGYYTKKYTPTANADGESIAQDVLGGASFMISQFQDYFSIRYADVLLMAAELGSANALDYVNAVHTRAGLDPLPAIDKDIIFEERRLELAFEGHRYWDLLRYDASLDYAANAVSFSGTVLNGGVEEPKTIDGANLKATRGLFQIPYNQITLSEGVLEQNQGW